MDLEMVEEFQAALIENKSDFGVKSCHPIENPQHKGEWGVHIVYEYDDKGNRAESSVDVFVDHELGIVMHQLYQRAGGP